MLSIVRYVLVCISLSAAIDAGAATVVVTAGDGGNYFKPAYATINPGDTVKWVWVSGHHNTASVSLPVGGAGWYSNLDQSTTTYSYVAGVSGLYNYTCTHHSGMDGQIFVTGCSFPDKPIITATGNINPCYGGQVSLTTQAQPGVSYLCTGIFMPCLLLRATRCMQTRQPVIK